MKKIVSIVCIIVLLLSLNVCAFAETEGSDEKIVVQNNAKQEKKITTSPASTAKTVGRIPSFITNISKTDETSDKVVYSYFNTKNNLWYNVTIIDGNIKGYITSTDDNFGSKDDSIYVWLAGDSYSSLYYIKYFDSYLADKYNSETDSEKSSPPSTPKMTMLGSPAVSPKTAQLGNTTKDTDDNPDNSSVVESEFNNSYSAHWVKIEKGINMLLSPAWLEVDTDEFDAQFTHSSNSKYTAIVLSELEEYKSTKTIDEVFYSYVDKGYQDKLVKININGIPALGVIQEDTYIVVLQKADNSFIQIRFLNFDENDSAYLNYIEQMVKTISFSN